MTFVFDVCLIIINTFVCVFHCSADLIPAFKDVTLESLKAAGVGPSPAAAAPPPAAAAPAAPAAPGSSYPTHMKVGVFLFTKQSPVLLCHMQAVQAAQAVHGL